MQAIHLNKATEIAKDIIRKVVKEKDIVIDATVGNGNDTLFLCDLVGEKGKVIGFDVQEVALERTKEKLEEKGLINRTTLIKDGHENLSKYIDGKVSAIMFNLGYLPKADHNITTKYKTTLEAIKKGIELLNTNGIITIVVYPGHEEGKIEKEKIIEYLAKTDQNLVNVLKLEFINQINNPPFLIALEKKQ